MEATAQNQKTTTTKKPKTTTPKKPSKAQQQEEAMALMMKKMADMEAMMEQQKADNIRLTEELSVSSTKLKTEKSKPKAIEYYEYSVDDETGEMTTTDKRYYEKTLKLHDKEFLIDELIKSGYFPDGIKVADIKELEVIKTTKKTANWKPKIGLSEYPDGHCQANVYNNKLGCRCSKMGTTKWSNKDVCEEHYKKSKKLNDEFGDDWPISYGWRCGWIDDDKWLDHYTYENNLRNKRRNANK
mgnify:CR=1 FL=1|tara:strand:- start:274 stop:999 length:726 start_codon:yes stop_codon:yes gene_type:complete